MCKCHFQLALELICTTCQICFELGFHCSFFTFKQSLGIFPNLVYLLCVRSLCSLKTCRSRSCSATRWKKGGEATARFAASSLKVAVKPTDLKYSPATDYRYGKTSGPSNMSSRNDDMIANEMGTTSGAFGF